MGSEGRWGEELPGEGEEEMVGSGLPRFMEPKNPKEILLGEQENEVAGLDFANPGGERPPGPPPSKKDREGPLST